ncbi:MAG: PhoX family phosphatase, partial [Pseudomonadota bacterium]
MSHHDDTVSNPRAKTTVATISDIVAKRLSRRDFLGGATALSGLALSGCAPSRNQQGAGRVSSSAAFDFAEITRGVDGTHHVPEGYVADVLLRWGDPLFPDSPAFDPQDQSVEAQHKLFGQNNDFVGFIALEPDGDGAERALLCVNHEYTTSRLMFPGVAENYPASMTAQHCEIEMAAHGSSIVEIKFENGRWNPVVGSKYTRRITAATTPMTITGPAAGHDRLKTSADPKGLTAAGTMNNCAGGITAWGTYLMAEENFHGYFSGDLPESHGEADNYERYGVGGSSWYAWGRHFDRYNLEREPNEPNRFGWIVEVDPFDPASTPKKRTAIGRYKHEGAESVIAPDGRVVLYSGDDERFEYVYKFISAGRYDPDNRAANMNLLEDGTLYVARFGEDGTVDWLPLTFGQGPLTPENQFYSQADVLIETRRAADLLGATPMDRPEDVEPDPRT